MNKLPLLLPLLALSSCHVQERVVEVPVEVVKKEYVHDVRTDSVFVKDSTDRWLRNDTMFIYKESVRYKYVFRTDTVTRTDTIPKTVKVETVKEVKTNNLTWWQKILAWIGGLTSIGAVIKLTYKIALKRKF